VSEGNDRLLDVLERVMRSPDRDWGVRELAGKVDSSVSSVHRTLADLAARGFVQLTETGKYRAGGHLFALASLLLSGTDLISNADACMEVLVAKANETAYLVLYDEASDHGVFTRSISCDQPLRYVIKIGSTTPLNVGAAGKAILSQLPDEFVDVLPLSTYTSKSIGDRQALMLELATIRDAGYAVSVGERLEEASGIAAPIVLRGQVVGAVTLTIPTARLRTERIPELGGYVAEAARSIAERTVSVAHMVRSRSGEEQPVNVPSAESRS
jgi:DNA-binding IclR family transcriptional regulator